jgi:hypothetical protein
MLSGTSNSNLELTITVVAADVLTVSETLGANETAGSCKVNQIKYSQWQDFSGDAKIIGSIYATTACDYWIEQSWDGVTVDVRSAKADLGAATLTSFSVEVVALFGRLKLLNEDTDQTVMRAYIGGREVS